MQNKVKHVCIISDVTRIVQFLFVCLGLPPAPVQLLFPISRFRTLQSLQHICRFEIIKHVRKDHIHLLPIPHKIKDYLLSSQYYIEEYS